MSQDHASWDRKDLLRQRKHERPAQSFDSSFRWRNLSTVSSSHYVPREFSRWASGDLRRPPGHGKQGGRHQFVEEIDHVHASSRSSARIFEDDNYRPSASRGDWRYNRNSRDSRVSFSQKDWKSHTWEVNNGSPRALGRLSDMKKDCSQIDERSSSASDPRTAIVKLSVPVNSSQPNIEVCVPEKTFTGNSDQNLGDQRLSSPSCPHSDFVGLYEQPYLEDKHDYKVCSPGRQYHDVSCDQRLADDSSLRTSDSHADLEVSRGQLYLKDQQDNGVHGVSGIHISEQFGKECSLGSIDRKHPIWTRSGNFASRGSGFSHTSSSKSFGAFDSCQQKTEFLPNIVAVAESASGDAAACFTSSCLPEEMHSRKKPRLGWGEGLAKYEKKKVDVNVSEDGTTLFTNSTREAYSLVDKSPTTGGTSDFGSPTTPSSVACSSSPGMGDKASGVTPKGVSDVSNLCCSPSPVSNNQHQGFPLNLEEVDNITMENFGCLLNEVLRNDDSGLGDSCSVQLSAMNKLLAWKSDVLKALEVTESEIDLLENKRRASKFEAGCLFVHQVGPSSYLCANNDTVLGEQEACVAERVEGAIHSAVSAKVYVDASGEGVERSQGTPEIPSIKTATSFTDVDMSGFAIGSTIVNGEAAELSSGGCSMAPNEEDVLSSKILASNSNSACEASDVFNVLLPRQFSLFDDSRFSSICQRKIDPHIKQRIAVRRRLLRVREKILVLQFKAFQFSWKNDLHQLAIAKYHAKSQKKCESNLYMKNGVLQKLPQSVRLKFSSPAPGRDSAALTTELVTSTGKLLLDIQRKPCRDILRMPAMILDEKEKVISRFMSSNGLVEDPSAVEKERKMINPWTSEEREIFLNKFAAYGKDFRKIASHLEQKTTADCVDFYYKNHKSDCFEKIKKKKLAYGKEEKCTYMMAPRKKWKRETNAASLDILGDVSVIAANASKVASSRQMSSKRITLRGCSSSRSVQHSDNSSEGYFYKFDLPDKQIVAADVLAGGDGPLSSGPISSCIRSSIDPEEKCMKNLKFDSTVKTSQISDATHNYNSNDEDDTCSEESCEQTGPIHWTDEERSAFMQGFSLYGKNFAMISQCIGTRSQDQCRVFFSKIRKCLGLEFIQTQSGDVSTSASVDNANEGGRSEVEDPCTLEASSVMCNGDLCAKMDANSPNSPFNINHDGADHSSVGKLKTDLNRSEEEIGMPCLHLKDGVELVDTNVSLNGDCPDFVSEVGRDFVDDKTVENQSQDVQESKSDHLLSTATDGGVLASTVLSLQPSSSNPAILANLIMESFTQRFGKYSDSVTTSRTRNPAIQAEATLSSGLSFLECLHHVPIEMCMEDPVGVHLPRENPSSHSETGSPKSLAVQVVERHNLDTLSSNVHLGFGEKHQFYGHVNSKQNSLQDVHVSNTEAFQIPWSSFMQDPSGKRSKSDVVITTLPTGEGFSLNRCSSLKSNGSTSKQLRLSHKESRSAHSRRHSRSLSDTERPYQNGNVKLFGTILTSHENGNKQMHHPQESVWPSTTVDQRDLQNVPITSYGFWDGNRIRTGFTSLPESARVLAQNPKAFATHVESSTSEVRVGSSREIQLDGLSVYTRRKLNGSGEIRGFERQIDHNGGRVGFLSFGDDAQKQGI